MEEDKKQRGEALLPHGSQKTPNVIIDKIQIKKLEKIPSWGRKEAKDEIKRIIKIIKYINDSLSYCISVIYKL